MLIIFLHIIWHLLAGSGLQELLKMVYPGNTILSQIMTGTAVPIAVLGHMQIDTALTPF